VDQNCPWEVEILVLAPAAELPVNLPRGVRGISMPAGAHANEGRDRAAKEASSDILVFLSVGSRPHSDRWLTDLTDPFFEGEDVAVISASVIGEGEDVPASGTRTWHRHDTSDQRLDVDLGAIAMLRDVARRISFQGETGSSWMAEVLSSGHPHRSVPDLPVVRGGQQAPTPSVVAVPVSEPVRSTPQAPKPVVPERSDPVFSTSDPAIVESEPVVEAPAEEWVPRPAEPTPVAPSMGSFWMLPAHIAGRTFERWIHAAVDSEERTVGNVLKAPFSATKDVLTDYRRGGALIPGFLTRDE